MILCTPSGVRLAANAGAMVMREEILDTLWSTDFVAETNIVERYVRGFRVKLENVHRNPRYIETVRGQGDRFNSPATADR